MCSLGVEPLCCIYLLSFGSKMPLYCSILSLSIGTEVLESESLIELFTGFAGVDNLIISRGKSYPLWMTIPCLYEVQCPYFWLNAV